MTWRQIPHFLTSNWLKEARGPIWDLKLELEPLQIFSWNSSFIKSSSFLILQMLQRSQIPFSDVLSFPTTHIDLQLYEGDGPYLLIALLHLYGLLIEQVACAGQPGPGIYMRNWNVYWNHIDKGILWKGLWLLRTDWSPQEAGGKGRSAYSRGESWSLMRYEAAPPSIPCRTLKYFLKKSAC